MMEKFLLLSNPTAMSHKAYPRRYFPFGSAYIAGQLRATGDFDVKSIDYQWAGVTNESVAADIRANGYRYVGVKAYAVDYLWLIELVEFLRSEFGDSITIIIGGPIATFSYDVLLKGSKINFCVLGEADTTLIDLLENIDSPQNAAGVAYLDASGKVVRTPGGQYPGKDLDDLAWPAYNLFNIDQYTPNRPPFPGSEKKFGRKYRTLDFITGRGCPFECSFCGRISRKYRKRSVDAIVEEMQYLMQTYDITHFAIEDELFVQVEDWVAEFCDKVRPLDIHWRCQSRARGLTPEVLAMMKSAGCQRITLGVESGSETILKSMNKKITPDDIRYSVKVCREAGIFPGTELIIGMPGETEETVRETIDLFQELHLPEREMAFLQLLPGTPLFYQFLGKTEATATHEKILRDISADDGTLKTFIHNVSGLPDDELIRLKNEAEAEMSANFNKYRRQHETVAYYSDVIWQGLSHVKRKVQNYGSANFIPAVPTNLKQASDHR